MKNPVLDQFWVASAEADSIISQSSGDDTQWTKGLNENMRSGKSTKTHLKHEKRGSNLKCQRVPVTGNAFNVDLNELLWI